MTENQPKTNLILVYSRAIHQKMDNSATGNYQNPFLLKTKVRQKHADFAKS